MRTIGYIPEEPTKPDENGTGENPQTPATESADETGTQSGGGNGEAKTPETENADGDANGGNPKSAQKPPKGAGKK